YSIAASSAVERLILTGSTDINGAGADLNETIIGQRGANILIGNEGNDTLFGGAGNDTIVGGAGNDELSGGGNVDLFRFGASAEGQDTITDLQFGNDLFDLSGGLFTGLSEANGDTMLTYAAGTILVEGIVGKSLAQWNGHVVSGGGASSGRIAQPDFGHGQHDDHLPHAPTDWLLS
ncbi:MAG: hypothetical protein IT548_13210, partial [Alphaproteobacteria bacterium]|nr:hypothetical protein [Alphaproteobacteria bacterium]